MLKHLYIKNYALIAHLDMEWSDGFTSLTGETGAGKSILLGALSLVMGGKADVKTITEGEDKCIIEATFVHQDQELLIRRELNAQGRSRSFVNDEVVSMVELKQLSSQLIDIHSQHENLLLGDDRFALDVVDTMASNASERSQYEQTYHAYQHALTQRKELEELARKSQQDADYIAFQYHQLKDAHLVAGEYAALQEEEYRLSHAEEIALGLQDALQRLDGEGGALSLVGGCHVHMADEALQERLNSARIEIKDIIRELQHLSDSMEINPARLEQVQERLSELQSLQKKHHVDTEEELITLRDELEQQVNRLDRFDEDLALLQKAEQQAYQAMQQAAQVLTRTREAVREKIVHRLVEDLTRLGIAHAQVGIDVSPSPDYTLSGHDQVQFLFAANLGQSMRHVAEVASGGEIARLMLCIKALIASHKGLPTIIFDEIDTGVSGEVASQMGTILKQLGKVRQVIAITHLPQIAAKSDTQFSIYKTDTECRTETHIRPLQPEERVIEIAQLLSGKHPSEEALITAKQLIQS